MKKILSARLPAVNDIVLTFAFTAFLVYARTIYVYIWALPSWMKSLNVGELLIVLSYALVFGLLETLGIVLALLIVGFILPAAWFRNAFAVRSIWLVFVLGGSLWIMFDMFDYLSRNIKAILLIWSAVTAVLAVLAAIVAPRLRFMRAAALWFSDRAIVFLYLFLPLSVIGFVAVTIRLLLINVGH